MDAGMVRFVDLPDEELVCRAQQHDDAAFEELMRRTSPASLRLAVSILKDREEAEDQVQNSYMNAWRHFEQFHMEAKFSTWISRIVVNHCLMRLRKVRNAGLVPLVSESSDGEERVLDLKDRSKTPEESLFEKELSASLKREIYRLPPLLRGVLILRDLDDLPTAEVATRLGLTPAAVKCRLLRARNELKKRLEKHRDSSNLVVHTA